MRPERPAPTVADVLVRAAQRLSAASIDDARLEAELLLANACQIDRAHVIARLHDVADPGAVAAFAAMLERRLQHEPLAYITGRREFYGIEIACDPRALIPRPETELLVDLVLAEVRARGDALRIVDVGTGTGAIACAVAVHAHRVRVTAVDASPDALALARHNVCALGIAGRVEFRNCDLLAGLAVFDVIVANLPYVSAADFAAAQPEVRDFEPSPALVPGALGTETNARLLAEAPAHLAAAGLLAMEMGDAQAGILGDVARTHFPAASVSVMKDLAGRDRVLVVRC